MFEPERKSNWYFILVLGVAVTIGWSILNHYQPLIIKTSCSEIASRSSGLIHKNNEILDKSYSYENVKNKCIEDSGF